MSSDLVDLVIEEPAWTDALPEIQALADTAAHLALDVAKVDPERWSICILACDDTRIAELNHAFRDRPVPTNVLSWPAFELSPDRPGALPQPAGRPRHPLGDIAVAFQTTRREAMDIALPLKDHAVHLILHGCLHLLGYDHETDKDAELMERIETRALARVGIADPYARREAGDRHSGSLRHG